MSRSNSEQSQDRVIVSAPLTLIAKIDNEVARQQSENPHHTVTRSHVIRQAITEFLGARAA